MSALINIYKAFVRPNLHYRGILYGQIYNSSFHEKLKSIQQFACLSLGGAIRGLNNKHPEYPFNLIPVKRVFQSMTNVLN